jgi:hypothetical protein
MKVELLYFDGCPNHEAFLPHLRKLLSSAQVDAEVELRRVESPEEAERERFLGSPTLRIDGRDVERGAEHRDDFGFKCRLFRSEEGVVGMPPDAWVLTALGVQQLPQGKADSDSAAERALQTVGLAPGLLAECRAFELDNQDRSLYRLIIERLSSGNRPTHAWLAERAGLDDVRYRLDALAAADLIGLDGDGEVALAYPLSATRTRHRVDTLDGRQLWACCAIDALGIPAMLDVDAIVSAREPDGDAEITVALGPTGHPRPDPKRSVVLAALAGDGSTACCACPFINFFPSAESAKAFQRGHPELRGSVMSIEEATEAGRQLFGGLFAYLGR